MVSAARLREMHPLDNSGVFSLGEHAALAGSIDQMLPPGPCLLIWGDPHSATSGIGSGSGTTITMPRYIWDQGFHRRPFVLTTGITYKDIAIHTASTTASFVAGTGHSLLVQSDGTLWGMGDQSMYQINGTTSTLVSLTKVGSLTTWDKVAVGSRYSLAIRGGMLYSIGESTNGQTGYNSVSVRTSWGTVGSDTIWVEISAGSSSSYGRKSDGTIWAWGLNTSGRTGLGLTSGNTLIPTQIGSDTDWTKIKAGSGKFLALKSNGTLWGAGSNGQGQLGTVSPTTTAVPIQVGTFTDIIDFDSNSDATLVLRSDGSLWGVGRQQNNNAMNDQPVGTYTEFVSLTPGRAWTSVHVTNWGTWLRNAANELWHFGYSQNSIRAFWGQHRPLTFMGKLPANAVFVGSPFAPNAFVYIPG